MDASVDGGAQHTKLVLDALYILSHCASFHCASQLK
jgi:hypothetical protein